MDERQRELEHRAAASPGDEAAVQAYLNAMRRGSPGRQYREALMRFRPVSFRSLLVREPEREMPAGMGGRRFEQFLPIQFGDSKHMLSVQASDTHYSEPRAWHETAEPYQRFEVGFLHGEAGLSFLPKGCPHRDEAESWGYGGYDDEGNEVPFDPEAEGLGNSSVYPYMEVEHLQAVFAWLFVEYGEAASVNPRAEVEAAEGGGA